MSEGEYDKILKGINRGTERYETRGRFIEDPNGLGTYILTEWDDEKNSGRETILTSDEIINESEISRETYNWATSREQL